MKKGDTVKILTGADRGKTGKVLRMFPSLGRVIVEGVNVKKKHLKPRHKDDKGGIVDVTHPVHISNVQKVGETSGK